MDFRNHIRSKILKKSDRILEFGPLIRPVVEKKNYPNIYFADVRSTEDIKKLYTSNDYMEATGIDVDINSVAEIDYVVTKSYTETFKNEEKFDVVYLSHVIEHMPDIIFFLKDVANILKEDGKLVLIYPDARYCFDHFRNGTTFVDAYDVYVSDEKNKKAVFDFTYNVVHENSPEFFWGSDDVVKILPKNNFKDAVKTYDNAEQNDLPEDVHFWPFSDYQFVKFLYDMDRAGMLDFDISLFHETQINTQEFMIVLKLKNKKVVDYKKYQKILSTISPANKMNKILTKNSILVSQLADKEKIVQDLSTELQSIYKSKRWQIATKLAKVNKVIPKRK